MIFYYSVDGYPLTCISKTSMGSRECTFVSSSVQHSIYYTKKIWFQILPLPLTTSRTVKILLDPFESQFLCLSVRDKDNFDFMWWLWSLYAIKSLTLESGYGVQRKYSIIINFHKAQMHLGKHMQEQTLCYIKELILSRSQRNSLPTDSD